MPPPTPAVLYTDRASVEDVLSAEGVTLAIDDDGSGTESPTELTRVDRAVAVATATVNRYCQARYEPAELAKSYSVWEWASVLAAAWLARRRGRPGPKSLLNRYDQVMEDLGAVRDGSAVVEDAQARVTSYPAVTNFVIDPRYRVKQIRVQRRISDDTPREGRPPAIDYPSDYAYEP